ncbi:C6 zinc finger protein [Colletotrichum higginsianum IMI 349063]|uniref:C6 zinc finger protein n=2 Tax=Colletotrichum higginsianum (strain IMI 349063) TaxID=759273 RepID=A0A1B7YMK6_COLHI|nr:C6 zinc finger protein [Colletotrichum higginsianum IMI 349063]OBR13295.1 C6 zinc finger protein [Colletotrichum higginsianum IMI 349063]
MQHRLPSMTNHVSLVTRFALDHKPQLTRASKPKVRTGCITCRHRRVKCDEGRPACSACLKYQGHCGGYKSNATQKPSRSDQLRPILPRLAGRKADNGFLLEPNYTSLVFADQLEKDHFDYWLAFTGTTVLFQSDLLTQVIPQLSWKDPAIKHAALAIGASALGGSTRTERMLGKGRFTSDSLVHYGKALNLLYTSPMSPERTLLACLLFITFESLRGNKAAGLSHINHGSRILEQYNPQDVDPSPLLDEVMTSFQHFGLQSWSHGGTHPKETDSRVPWCCRGRRTRYAVQEMPSAFANLETARRWWNIVRHHLEHHAPLHTGFRVEGSSATTVQRPPPDYASPESQQHIRSFARFLDAWNLAFQPLAIKAESGRATDIAGYLKALSLRIHYLHMWSGIRTAGWTDVEDIGRVTPVFRDIVALSREFLSAQGARQLLAPNGEMFTLEDSPTWPLGSAFLMCAVREVKDEVIRLFKEYPRRDGLWDTHGFLVMMEWLNGMTSAGYAVDERRHVAECDVVFREHSVMLQKKLWDPAASKWIYSGASFSIL